MGLPGWGAADAGSVGSSLKPLDEYVDSSGGGIIKYLYVKLGA